jgi:inosine/xanthosine triphosphate pyrophosphatase family protein
VRSLALSSLALLRRAGAGRGPVAAGRHAAKAAPLVARTFYLHRVDEVVIGTTNAAKARQVELALEGTRFATRRLADLVDAVPEIAEDGVVPEENAARKAVAYAEFVARPVVSLDYGLVFDSVPADEPPGVNVRRIPGVAGRPTDEDLLNYYAALFRRHGGAMRGRWLSAVAAATPGGHVARATAEVSRVFVADACDARVPGHPLASLQLVGDRYVAELDEGEESALMRETLRESIVAVVSEALGHG